ncbi:hypothetical protein [Clostridium sp.]|uniref:hypothetical protein n=1 Tax=Clostridium sp. TaxID=1506 RepID=UPI002FC8C343
MTEFELFKEIIVGHFSNLNQVEQEGASGNIIHPMAKHINGICNHKIYNLPDDFNGIFVIEESYYTYLDKDLSTSMPHLFLFEETESGHVKLTSYDIPDYVNREFFTNDNNDLFIDYNELKVSSKFNPMTYEYIEEKGFYGRSLSNFSPTTTFLLDETLSMDKFEVTEILKKGDRVLIGFDSPIIYNRVN